MSTEAVRKDMQFLRLYKHALIIDFLVKREHS